MLPFDLYISPRRLSCSLWACHVSFQLIKQSYQATELLRRNVVQAVAKGEQIFGMAFCVEVLVYV